MQGCSIGIGAGITGDQVQGGLRDVQQGPFGVFDSQELGLGSVDVERGHARRHRR